MKAHLVKNSDDRSLDFYHFLDRIFLSGFEEQDQDKIYIDEAFLLGKMVKLKSRKLQNEK